MYASSLICSRVCNNCEEMPCGKNWLQKNECPKIIAENERLGECCATCLHCVEWKYCSKKRTDPDEDVYANRGKYLIDGPLDKGGCELWDNTWEEL